MAFMTVGCGEGSDDPAGDGGGASQSAEKKKPKSKPAGGGGQDQVITCLIRGGADDAEKRDKDLWRGGGLIVHLYKSPAEAERNTKGVDVAIEAAGKYTVVAPFQTDSEAEAAVATVADCLRNG